VNGEWSWGMRMSSASHDLSLMCSPYYCGEKVENVVEERDNRNPKGGKVPLA